MEKLSTALLTLTTCIRSTLNLHDASTATGLITEAKKKASLKEKLLLKKMVYTFCMWDPSNG